VARITSSLFVSALMRRVTSAGGFAAIARKGSDAAGAIYIVIRERNGVIRFYGPAPQSGYLDDQLDDRQFQMVEYVGDDSALSAFEKAESRFDPDFWIVEIEPGSEIPDLFAVMKP
jgi:hypothetical protein